MADPAETRRLIERYIEALNDRSVSGVLSLLAEDVAHDPNQDRRRIGRQAFEAALIHRLRLVRETASDLVVLVSDDGHRASAEYTLRGTYLETGEGLPPATGQTYSLPGAAFFEVDEGRISRVSEYLNLNEFVRQVSA